MSKHADLYDASGRVIPLGHKLGSGGEGDVYEVPAVSPALVAKVYHQPLPPAKQDKLRNMVQGCDDALQKIAAWPIATLQLGHHGPIRGFLMPKVAGYEPVHNLYSPAHRKQRFPQVDWAFLVNVARNVAAAFDVIHRYGHVIGDVNQGNVVVARNSVVKLIDCDSFQIAVGGKHHLCEVGVPHFTPPELQRLHSFHDVQRTANHDNFGLAVLCFHLLFMGWHPFSGVYAGQEDLSIERAIESFRFAFGTQAASKGMSPPPNSVTMAIVSPQVSRLFERAFSESGVLLGGRPKAREWISVLESLQHSLRTCSHASIHKYEGSQTTCPWCALERRAGGMFFIGVVATPAGEAAFNLTSVWQRIMSVPSPGAVPVIALSQFSITPNPLPPHMHKAKIIAMSKHILAVVLILGTPAIHPGVFIIGLIVAVILFCSKGEYAAESQTRQRALEETQRAWNDLELRWREEGGDAIFQKKLGELAQMKSAYQRLEAESAQEKQQLHATLKARQLHKFLDSFFIDNHKIPHIGPGRKATLASFGIETAADIDPKVIQNIKGFGASITGALLQWRRTLESRFVFDPSKSIDPADIRMLTQKFRQRMAPLEGALLAGAETLSHMRAEIMRQRHTLQMELEAAARALAQARSDIAVCGWWAKTQNKMTSLYAIILISIMVLLVGLLFFAKRNNTINSIEAPQKPISTLRIASQPSKPSIASVIAEEQYWYVNTINLNLRQNPGANQPVLQALPLNTKVMLSGEKRQVGETIWVKVKTMGSPMLEGWVNEAFIRKSDAGSN